MLDCSTGDLSGHVRIAQPSDEDELMDMYRQIHLETGLRSVQGLIPLSEDKVRGVIQRALIPNRNSPDLPALIGVLGSPGDLYGSVYLSAETPWYSDHIVLQERWSFVYERYRNTDAVHALIEFGKRLSDAINVSPLIMGIMSANDQGARARLYRRFIGAEHGVYFSYAGAVA